MDGINKLEYGIADLSTRSVVLSPNRAQVSRELQNAQLKPGTNEITITGLSPTVDQDSIKVEGSGSAATITDIVVEPLPNRQDFDLVYPDSEGEESDDQDDADEDELAEDEQSSSDLQGARERLIDLVDSFDMAGESLASAASRLNVLDSYAKTLSDPEREVDIGESLETYRTERSRAFADHLEAVKTRRTLTRDVEKVKSEIRKLEEHKRRQKAKETKEKQKAIKEKEKAREAKRRKAVERRAERARLRQERLKFWPKYCFSVCITIECTAYTPESSRRGSLASHLDLPKEPSDDMAQGSMRCDLVLSYVTSEAGWTPCYDVNISTTDATAALCFDAQVRNKTSETWSGCKVILSTSQATFGGLSDILPSLTPWNLRLKAKGPGLHEDITLSREEARFANYQWHQTGASTQVSREKMFGPTNRELDAADCIPREAWFQRRQGWAPDRLDKTVRFPPQGQTLFGARIAQEHEPDGPAQGGLFGSSNTGPAAFGAANSTSGGGFGGTTFESSTATAFGQVASCAGGLFGSNEASGVYADAQETLDEEQTLDFEDSIVEDMGFTTSYEIPGLKSLAPKSSSSKQRVMRLTLSNVALRHTVVAKLRPVATLIAKVKNTSKLTLPKGPAGLVLDGAFLGRTTMPQCSAGEPLTLHLGVDPAVQVKYGRPAVRKDPAGFFSKEDTSVYTRVVTLHNTRVTAGRAAAIRVLDQVPVSQDDRLRISILSPGAGGLSVDGPDVVADGVPGRDESKDQDWGQASAMLEKDGLVTWKVDLNAGKAVRLTLEYAISSPSGDVPTEP